jgi:hypothetical protein
MEAKREDPTSEQVLTCQREKEDSDRIYKEARLRYQIEHPEAYAEHMNQFRVMVSYYEDETDFESSSSDDDDSVTEDELLAMAEFEDATRRYEAEKRRFFEQYPHLQGRFHN